MTAILNLRGRLAYSRLPVKKSEMARATGRASNTSSASTPDTGHAADVAGRVATGLHGGEAHVPEALPDAGDVLDADPVDLDGLAGGDVGVAVAEHRAVVRALGEGVGDDADLADLGRGQDAAGDLDPHHEGVAALALGVEADPLEPLHLAGHRVERGEPSSEYAR